MGLGVKAVDEETLKQKTAACTLDIDDPSVCILLYYYLFTIVHAVQKVANDVDIS